MKTSFTLEKIKNEYGNDIDTIVKHIEHDDGKIERDEMCDVISLDKFFDACVDKWGSNWDLNKVMTAIREADFL